jgi:outer membrane protein TolC
MILSGAALLSTTVVAQSTERLTLEDAERIAIQNHPQIQAAREMAVAADQMVRQARSAYYRRTAICQALTQSTPAASRPEG